jgi:diacylglycerol kinase (ATP)
MLGVIPLGTANDFVRSLDIAPDPLEAVETLARGRIRTIDAVRFEVDGRGEWMINVAAGGNSTEIVENIDPELKQRLGPWCYVRGAIDLLGGLSRYRVRLAVNDGPPERLDIVNMIVANGRSVATMEVAPDADLADGQLEVVTIRDAPISAQARVAADFFTGDYRQSDPVVQHRAGCVDLWCDERIGFTIDGEVHWGRHFRFAIRPSALRVVVGNAPA